MTAQTFISNRATLKSVWLEVTGKCALQCSHCYAESGPTKTHGLMTVALWKRTIDEAIDAGCTYIQFIGGEPTLHPEIVALMRHCYDKGVPIELYSNLTKIAPNILFEVERGYVDLATSLYGCDASEHDAVTKVSGSFDRTLHNITKVRHVARSLRVGFIMEPGPSNRQRVGEFCNKVGIDRYRMDGIRAVGRGLTSEIDIHGRDQALCGECANKVAAIMPDGGVYPCIFARHRNAGNVISSDLKSIIHGELFTRHQDELLIAFDLKRQISSACNPGCTPGISCNPQQGCVPTEGCGPVNCTPR